MTEFTSVITRAGRAVVPPEVLETLGLKHGDTIAWVQENGHIEVRRAKSITERTAGILNHGAIYPVPGDAEIDDVIARAIAEEVVASMDRDK